MPKYMSPLLRDIYRPTREPQVAAQVSAPGALTFLKDSAGPWRSVQIHQG